MTFLLSQGKILDVMRLILNGRYTVGHTKRVTEISLAVGKEIGLPPDELDDLHWGALFHDIGKIALKPEILNKPGALTLEEYRHIMTHSVISLDIAKPMVNERVLEIISHHHDHYDGSGLGQTIDGEDIPLGARILALADAFDAMTSDRPYRAAMSYEEAFAEVRRCSGTQFDPGVDSAFLKIPKEIISEGQRMKKVIEDGHKRPLIEFAQCAVIHLERYPECDEVVQKSNNIIELEHDIMTSPSLIYNLPEGYEYNFSEIIGIVRTKSSQTPLSGG